MKKIIPIIVCALVIGSGAFYAGTKYSQGKGLGNMRAGAGTFINLSPEERQARMQEFGAGAGAGGRVAGGSRAGGAVAGEILSMDDKSVTVKLRDGGSKIIFISGSTQVMKTIEGSAKDLVVGEQITVMGSANSDGSVSGQTIQIRQEQPQK